MVLKIIIEVIAGLLECGLFFAALVCVALVLANGEDLKNSMAEWRMDD